MDYPLIQGVYYSWHSLAIKAQWAGNEFEDDDFAALDWDDSLTPAAIRARKGHKRGRTFGEPDAAAKISLWLAAADRFEAKLAEQDSRIGVVEFDINGSWQEAETDPVSRVRLVQCRIIKRTQTNAYGPDGAAMDYELDVMQCFRNGISLW